MGLSRHKTVGIGICAALLALSVLLWPKSSSEREKRNRPLASESRLYSNVRAADYVGPTLCSECHEDRYQQWQGNLHRRMNRLVAEAGAVLGDFDDRRVPYAGGALLLQRRGKDYFMGLEREGSVHREYRVTRTIGSRYLQEYVGVQVRGPEPAQSPVYQTEIRLPFGFMLRERRWLHQQYFDSWYGDEYRADGSLAVDVFEPEQAPWRGRCAWCHNTYPFEKRLARIDDDQQIGSGIELLFEDHKARAAPSEEVSLLPVDELVSVGISCESCHFGGREHAVQGKSIRFAPAGEGIEARKQAPTIAGTRQDGRTINSICAQCHSVPTKLFANGAGVRNSSEALDLLSGACATRIKCTDCHDPHVPGPGALAAAQSRHLEACVGCHENLADADAALRHSKHSAETTCLDCHMPRIVQGMDTLIRSHRISSPDDPEMLSDGVNACNLCHLDKSLAWTSEVLVRDFGASTLLPLDARAAGEVWLRSSKRELRLVAAGSMRANAVGALFLPLLVEKLDDPVAHDRMRYFWAIEAVRGAPLSDDDYAVAGPPSLRHRQAAALQAAHSR